VYLERASILVFLFYVGGIVHLGSNGYFLIHEFTRTHEENTQIQNCFLPVYFLLKDAKIRRSKVSRLRPENHTLGECQMENMFLKLYVKFQSLANDQRGQDMVEYALLSSLIALALIASIPPIATAVTHVFNNVSSSLA